MNYGFPPVKTDGQKGEHAEGYSQVGDKGVDGAVEGSKLPVTVPHEDERGDTVQSGHHQVSQR